MLIGAVGLACAIATYIGTRYMQRAYMSTVSMLSAQEDTDTAVQRVTNQLGAVAGLLGVGAQGGRRDVNESLATLRSRVLVGDFLKSEEFLDDVLDIFGPEALVSLSHDDQLQAAISYFQDNILTVAYDTRSSLMIVSMTYTDRHIAAKLANDYIAFANEAMRQRAIASARNRIEFLHNAADDAATIDLRQAIYRLIETQVNAEMMAQTKPDYAFIIVDPAVPSGVGGFVRPQRSLLGLIAGMLGSALAFGVLVMLGRVHLPGARR